MKEFNLEAAKRGEPIVCRDGTPARFIAHVPEAEKSQRVVVKINKTIGVFHEHGRWSEIAAHNSDLFMAPKKRTVWVNFYGSLSRYFSTKYEADQYPYFSNTNRIGNRAYPVEIEE